MPPTRSIPRTKTRRKRACDLCFLKKIKCDLKEPGCSNCMLYHQECRLTSDRSKVESPNIAVASTLSAATNTRNHEESLNSRLEVRQKSLTTLEARAGSARQGKYPATGRSRSGETKSPATSQWKFDYDYPSLYFGPPDDSLWLPPLHELMPVVEYYFQTQNHFFPLFHQASFMRLITKWYSPKSDQDRCTWAAILVVIALGLQHMSASSISDFGEAKRRSWINYCMKNSQSVLFELMAREEDLLGLQVILSLCMLFRDALVKKPAAMLLGMAMRLINALHLHSKDFAKHLSEEEVRQRSNVFWMANILDKGISSKVRTPPIILDSDITTPPPSQDQPDNAGMVFTKQGDQKFSIFCHQVKLTTITMKIHELLYSNRSNDIDILERQSRVSYIKQLLEEWISQIPVTFQPENCPKVLDPINLLQMTALYHEYLACQVYTHGVWSSRSDWIRRIGPLSRAAVDDIAMAAQGVEITKVPETQNPPLLDAWDNCVRATRPVIALFHETMRNVSISLHYFCIHSSGLIVMLSNILSNPGHESVTQDLQLVTNSTEIFRELFDGIESSLYESTTLIVEDLRMVATRAASYATKAQDGMTEKNIDFVGFENLPPNSQTGALEDLNYFNILDTADFDILPQFDRNGMLAYLDAPRV